MSKPLLRPLDPDDVRKARRRPVDPVTLAEAGAIVDAVRDGGEAALREYAARFGDLRPDGKLVLGPAELSAARYRVPPAQRDLLERTADRIARFAAAQRDALRDGETDVPGGRAGWRFRPVERAGCYAPGGRFPLPSSVLMTAVTARVAGVPDVTVASPRPDDLTLAAAAVAGADRVLAVGGAQAVAALAYGAGPVPACDVVVGPGNRWVTAAKLLVSGEVGIDMAAGPSELVVLADGAADPAVVAADLLAQAEHDPDAVPILVSIAPELVPRVEDALAAQLRDLPTAAIARQALANGGAMVVPDLDAAVAACDALAPEHLELLVASPAGLAPRLGAYGGLFVGASAAEVLGDYGAGPNHVLPTGGTARFRGGLSVQDFLVARTWLELAPGPATRALARDAADLARCEGLEAHARAAERRAGAE